jgi:hypothetical protein
MCVSHICIAEYASVVFCELSEYTHTTGYRRVTRISVFSLSTVNLREIELWVLRLLLLGGIIENQNSDLVIQYRKLDFIA